MVWDTSYGWITAAACEVEPSPVVVRFVVSEPDQEPVDKSGYAWMDDDCVEVDKTRLGPFTVFVSSSLSFTPHRGSGFRSFVR